MIFTGTRYLTQTRAPPPSGTARPSGVPPGAPSKDQSGVPSGMPSGTVSGAPSGVPRPPPSLMARAVNGIYSALSYNGPGEGQRGPPPSNETLGSTVLPHNGIEERPTLNGTDGFPPLNGTGGDGFPPHNGTEGFAPHNGTEGFPPRNGTEGFPPHNGTSDDELSSNTMTA